MTVTPTRKSGFWGFSGEVIQGFKGNKSLVSVDEFLHHWSFLFPACSNFKGRVGVVSREYSGGSRKLSEAKELRKIRRREQKWVLKEEADL